MALIRRTSLLGPGSVAKSVESALGVAIGTARVAPPVPQQGSAAPAPVAPPVQLAAAAPTMAASTFAIISSFVLVGLGGVAAYGLGPTTAFRPGSTSAVYLGMLVFSAAIERLLEPFSHWLPGRAGRNLYDATVANMLNGHPSGSLDAVARARTQMDRGIANRAVLVWGLATTIATVVSSASGFYLLRMISTAGWTPNVPPWLDALVTGLVVGSGTKPLHDLITKAQTPKPGAANDPT